MPLSKSMHTDWWHKLKVRMQATQAGGADSCHNTTKNNYQMQMKTGWDLVCVYQRSAKRGTARPNFSKQKIRAIIATKSNTYHTCNLYVKKQNVFNKMCSYSIFLKVHILRVGILRE